MSAIITDIRQIIRYWWLFIIAGCLLLVLDVFIAVHPFVAYGALSFYFVLAFILNGLMEIVFGLSNRRALRNWGWHLAGGVTDLLAGVVLLTNPILAVQALSLFVGCWLLFRCIAVAGRVFDLPAMPWPDRGWLIFLAVAGLIFSFMILYKPELGAFTLLTWTVLAIMAIGVFYIFLGLALRKFRYAGRKSKRRDSDETHSRS